MTVGCSLVRYVMNTEWVRERDIHRLVSLRRRKPDEETSCPYFPMTLQVSWQSYPRFSSFFCSQTGLVWFHSGTLPTCLSFESFHAIQSLRVVCLADWRHKSVRVDVFSVCASVMVSFTLRLFSHWEMSLWLRTADKGVLKVKLSLYCVPHHEDVPYV